MILVDKFGRVVSDVSLEELHSWIVNLGYPKSAFQNSETIPHYMISKADVERAIYYGAKKVCTRKIIHTAQIIHTNREIRQGQNAFDFSRKTSVVHEGRNPG